MQSLFPLNSRPKGLLEEPVEIPRAQQDPGIHQGCKETKILQRQPNTFLDGEDGMPHLELGIPQGVERAGNNEPGLGGEFSLVKYQEIYIRP